MDRRRFLQLGAFSALAAGFGSLVRAIVSQQISTLAARAIHGRLTTALVDVTPEDYDFVMDTNTRGAFFVAQEVGKRMIARSRGAAPGTFTGGRIVNVASMAGLRPLSQIGVYAMSKAAVIHMTRAMALEWGKFGINVNALCPGYIDTEINHHHWQTEAGQKLIGMTPRKRIGEPKDLDAALMMLCANESRFINGAVLAADDGFGI